MKQLVYYSKIKKLPYNESALLTLRQILNVSRRNNAVDKVTGFLIMDTDWFVQVLEGEGSVVKRTFERINRDSRHTDAVIIGIKDVKQRCFGEWSMGARRRSPEVEEIYLLNGIGTIMTPSKLKAEQVVKLSEDLIDHARVLLRA